MEKEKKKCRFCYKEFCPPIINKQIESTTLCRSCRAKRRKRHKGKDLEIIKAFNLLSKPLDRAFESRTTSLDNSLSTFTKDLKSHSIF